MGLDTLTYTTQSLAPPTTIEQICQWYGKTASWVIDQGCTAQPLQCFARVRNEGKSTQPLSVRRHNKGIKVYNNDHSSNSSTNHKRRKSGFTETPTRSCFYGAEPRSMWARPSNSCIAETSKTMVEGREPEMDVVRQRLPITSAWHSSFDLPEKVLSGFLMFPECSDFLPLQWK